MGKKRKSGLTSLDSWLATKKACSDKEQDPAHLLSGKFYR